MSFGMPTMHTDRLTSSAFNGLFSPIRFPVALMVAYGLLVQCTNPSSLANRANSVTTVSEMPYVLLI